MMVVSPQEMRPNVDGADWYFYDNGDLRVMINRLSDWKRESLLLVHELVEALLCKHDGVTVAEVDNFDAEYDKTHSADLNAGDDPKCPYQTQHCIATAVERIMAAHMGINWESYDRELATTYPGPSHHEAA